MVKVCLPVPVWAHGLVSEPIGRADHHMRRRRDQVLCAENPINR